MILKKKRVEIEVVRGGSMSDEELLERMAVSKEQGVYSGVMEILDRLEDAMDDEYCSPGVEPSVRSDAGLQKGMIREIRKQIAGWRDHGEQIAKEKSGIE